MILETFLLKTEYYNFIPAECTFRAILPRWAKNTSTTPKLPLNKVYSRIKHQKSDTSIFAFSD